MTYNLGFAMAQVAGHTTQFRNLRSAASADPTIEATWCEIAYHRTDGRIERVTDRLGKGQSLRPVVDMFGGLGRADVDAILVNTPLVGLYPKRILDAPIMIDFDVTPLQLAAMNEYERAAPVGFAGRIRSRVQQRLWDRVVLFQAWSEWAKESAVNDYGLSAERIMVNPPGVDLGLWTPSVTAREERPSRPHRILFVGGDFRRKGGDVLMEWFQRSRPRDVELHIVTHEHVPPVDGVSVHHDMTANSARLIELYQNCDVFVLPTRAECFGIATVEAMASGLPVVVGDVGATSEIVDHGGNGYLVRPGDIDEFGDAISKILDDDALRQRMAERSRAIAEAKFSLDANAATTLSALKGLVDRATDSG